MPKGNVINERVRYGYDKLGRRISMMDYSAVNDWADSPSNTIVKVPNSWNDTTNNHNRENTYNEAIMHFK